MHQSQYELSYPNVMLDKSGQLGLMTESMMYPSVKMTDQIGVINWTLLKHDSLPNKVSG